MCASYVHPVICCVVHPPSQHNFTFCGLRSGRNKNPPRAIISSTPATIPPRYTPIPYHVGIATVVYYRHEHSRNGEGDIFVARSAAQLFIAGGRRSRKAPNAAHPPLHTYRPFLGGDSSTNSSCTGAGIGPSVYRSTTHCFWLGVRVLHVTSNTYPL